MNIPYVMRKCTKCGEWLVANNYNFSKKKGGKWGLKNTCKKCDKQWREEHKEERLEYMKQYYEEHKEEKLEYNKQWHKNNPEKLFNKHNKRRSKLENQGRGITKEQWYEMMNFFDWKCAYSGEKMESNKTANGRTIDHIVAWIMMD